VLPDEKRMSRSGNAGRVEEEVKERGANAETVPVSKSSGPVRVRKAGGVGGQVIRSWKGSEAGEEEG